MRMRVCVSVILALSLLALAAVGCATTPAAPSPSTPASTPTPTSVPAQTSQPIKWKLALGWGEALNIFQNVKVLSNRIDAMSAGRLKIDVYPGGALVPAFQELDAVEIGSLEAAYCSSPPYAGRLGEAALTFISYPGGPDAWGYISWVHHGGGQQLEQEVYNRAKVDAVLAGPAGGVGIEIFGWFNTKVTSLDNFKGMKFRTLGMWGETLKSLGASVVVLPGGELYQGLERGVLDAFEFGPPALDYPMGFYEIAKYVTVPGVHSPHAVHQLIVQGKAWRNLPPDLQAIVKNACSANAMEAIMHTMVQDAEAWEKIKASGIEVVVLPVDLQKQIIKASDKVMDAYAAKDPFIAQCINSQREFADQFTGYHGIKPITRAQAYE